MQPVTLQKSKRKFTTTAQLTDQCSGKSNPQVNGGGDVQTYFLNRAKLTIDIKSTPKDGCFAGGYGAALESAINGNAPRNRCYTREEAFSCWLIDAESADEELDYLRSKYQVLVDDRVRAEQKAKEEQRKKNKI